MGGDYADLIQTAQEASDAQARAQLCLRPDGKMVHADPSTAFSNLPSQPPADDDADELRRLRNARRTALQEEHKWRQQGHGSLAELKDEREFIVKIKPHDRAVVLLDDGYSTAGDDVKSALASLAKKHLESQFCWLRAERAFFLTHIVELEGYPTVFVLQQGRVRRTLSPESLFEHASSTSPLFSKHLARLLHRVGAITSAETENSDVSEDEEEERRIRRR